MRTGGRLRPYDAHPDPHAQTTNGPKDPSTLPGAVLSTSPQVAGVAHPNRCAAEVDGSSCKQTRPLSAETAERRLASLNPVKLAGVVDDSGGSMGAMLSRAGAV
jgi:hypothetical protein